MAMLFPYRQEMAWVGGLHASDHQGAYLGQSHILGVLERHVPHAHQGPHVARGHRHCLHEEHLISGAKPCGAQQSLFVRCGQQPVRLLAQLMVQSVQMLEDPLIVRP
jgi:hypothetical protein